jgi:glycosyltransferase involved in cell wall biosynthesis
MSRICLYFIRQPEQDRWILGDRYVRPLIRRLIRGKPKIGGVERVFVNLCHGLDKLEIKYEVNLPFHLLKPDDKVGILGLGRHCLDGYTQSNSIVAGIGLMTHPSEWKTLCKDYPIAKYLQHSEWANNVYQPYFGDKCHIWPVGIDTEKWQPNIQTSKTIDFLIYNKIRWNYEQISQDILNPIQECLSRKGLTFTDLRYGFYKPEQYQSALANCQAMIFLCEHESQGLAYQECLSSDVPILAWDQGECLDPNRFGWGDPHIPATSVPYWDNRCGVKFTGISEFPAKLEEFLDKLNQNQFAPRDYILENLTLEKCAQQYLDILNSVY